MKIAICLLISGVLIFSSCDQPDKPGRFDHLDKRTKIRLRQYLSEGRRLYNLHCANCHQTDGSGLARLYPPLHTDYLLTNKNSVICGMRYGQQGDIVVNGITFGQEMPRNDRITNLEIAEIATYIYTEFADSVQIITLNQVGKMLDNCQKNVQNP